MRRRTDDSPQSRSGNTGSKSQSGFSSPESEYHDRDLRFTDLRYAGRRAGVDTRGMNVIASFFRALRLRARRHGPAPLLIVAALLLAAGLAVSSVGRTPASAAAADEPSSTIAALANSEAAPGEAIVRFRDDTSATERRSARDDADASLERPLEVEDTQLVTLDRGTSVKEGVAKLEQDPNVLYAEPNYVRKAVRSPSDPLFSREWGLNNTGQDVQGISGTPDADIDAPEAWDLETGRSGVKVAVVDTGVDYGHPDLDGNIWTNPDEVPGNGVDDDRNTKVDDVRGWDFVGEPVAGGARTEDNDPQDENGHGTHVAGIVGAEGNDGTGVTGVSWDVSLMPLRVLDENGSGTVADVLDGYAYAAGEGADVINASLGGNGQSRTEADYFNSNPNVLFVVAAGNDGADVDAAPQFPCNQPQENVVCVAASDQSERLAGFSNYGRDNVDLAAPGDRILSTYPRALTQSGYQPYAFFDGTSMATPHVAGAAALVKSRFPGASVLEVKNRLLGTVDPAAAYDCKTFTGGRLNVFRALSTTSVSPVTQASCGSAPAPASAGSTTAAPSGGDSSGGSSGGDGSSGGGSDSSTEPAAPAIPSPVAPPAPVRASPTSRCAGLSPRRRTLCVRRERSLSQCARLSRTKRAACASRARRAYVAAVRTVR